MNTGRGVILAMWALGLATAVALAEDADARFSGGNDDGWDGAAMVDSDGLGGAQATLSSATDQTVAFLDRELALATLTIDVVEQGDPIGIAPGGVMRLRIPRTARGRFDTGVIAPVFGGTASNKVAATVTYDANGRDLVIEVQSNFLDGDTLTIDGVKLRDLALFPVGAHRLELDYTGEGVTDTLDARLLTAVAVWSGGADDGWDREAMVASAGLGGAQATLSSATDQTVAFFDQELALATMTINVVEQGNPIAIAAGGTMRLRIPGTARGRFDAGVTAPVFGGTASGNVAVTVTYEADGRELVIEIQQDFLTGDTLTIDGVKLRDLALFPVGAHHLELDYTGEGATDTLDVRTLTAVTIWPGGADDGWDGCASIDYRNIASLGTLFTIR